MDSKAWRWRRKASEKTIIASGRASLSLERNVEEDRENETESLRCPSNLSDRVPFGTCECNVKEELIRKHRRIAEQALAGQEMERAEAAYLRQELDKSIQQGAAAEKKLAHLNAALQDCLQEMESLRQQQCEAIRDASSKAKADSEKEQKKLEAKLAEANKRNSNLSAENANLMKALICKERLLRDLDEGKATLESELGILTRKLDSAEKENTLLKYEFRVMEKDLKLRNEERRFSRRSALENEKQINKLEAECQQLRHLVRKRLQADVQGTDQASMRRKRSNPAMANPSERSSKGTSFLIDKVYSLEDENTTLREILALSDSELQSWKIKYGQLASRLAELEVQLQLLQELPGGENSMQLALTSVGLSNYDGIGDSESWANALLAELEQFKQGKIRGQPECKAIIRGESIDEVEMEKFAIVSTGIAVQGSSNSLQTSSNELVPATAGNGSCKKSEKWLRPHSSWLDEILEVILEEHRVSNRNLGELLQDIKIALGQNDNIIKPKGESSTEICGFLTWESSDPAYSENPAKDVAMEDKRAPDVNEASFTREKIRKHFGFDRSQSENRLQVDSPNRHNTLAQMIAIQSTMREENLQMKEKLQKVTEDKVALKNDLHESKQKIASLQEELDSLKDSKGVTEDQIENQRLINEDLNTQLTVAKGKLNEILHKLSSLEIELEHRNNCCEDLEGTCLELQLQLETLSRKESPNTDIDQLAKQLFDKALCPTTAIMVPAFDKKSIIVQRSTLRDRMLAEKEDETEHLKSSHTEENLCTIDSEKPNVCHTEYTALLAPEPEVRPQGQGGALAIVPSKRAGGGFGFIRKLFLRRKRGCSKMNAIPLQRNTSALMKPRDALFLV